MKKTISFLLLFCIAINKPTNAQCTLTTGIITKTQNGTSCNARVCFTLSSGTPKRFEIVLNTPSGVPGVSLCPSDYPAPHAIPFDCGSGNNTFTVGTQYCYTFILANTTCSSTSFTSTIIGYLNAAGTNGGSCTLAPSNTTLPVILASLDATSSQSSISVNWKTSLEINSLYFEVQKSKDAINFYPIGRVDASNNYQVSASEEKTNYSFIDNKPVVGYNYYRLKQVDIDSSYEYSKIISAKFLPDGDIAIGPNPLENSVIQLLAKGFTIERVTLYSLDGKELSVSLKEVESKQLYHIIPSTTLAKGIYVIKIESELGIQSLKIIVD